MVHHIYITKHLLLANNSRIFEIFTHIVYLNKERWIKSKDENNIYSRVEKYIRSLIAEIV